MPHSDFDKVQGTTSDGRELFLNARHNLVDANGVPGTIAKLTRDTTFDPTGQDNLAFYEDSVVDRNGLVRNMERLISNELVTAGRDQGYSPESMANLFAFWWKSPGALTLVDNYLQGLDAEKETFSSVFAAKLQFRGAEGFDFEVPERAKQGASFVNTPTGFNELASIIWGFYGQKAGFDIGDFGVSSGGGRGGGGPKGPTDADIRNRYDLDRLSAIASDIWRGMLLDDNTDSRKMARAYVDEIVKSGGEKTIDYTEFIRSQARKTDRYASIYVNLPEAMSEEQYLTPYFQSAFNVVRPGDAADIAIGGAQFGSDKATFTSRLQRTDAATSSAPYINQLQSRLEGLNKLFKG